MPKYMLVSVCDREILIETFDTMEEGERQMKKEMEEAGIPSQMLNAYKEYEEAYEYAFYKNGGYYNGRYEWDWLLTAIPETEESNAENH